MNKGKNKKKNNMNMAVCGAVNIVFAAVLVVFWGVLLWTKFVPPLYLGVAAAAEILLLVFGVLMTGNVFKRRVLFVVGCIFEIIIVAIAAFGTYYLYVAKDTMTKLAQPKPQYVSMAVYVRSDDSAVYLNDLKGYQVGILEVIDRSNTDLMLKNIKKDTGIEFETEAVSTVTDLIDGLLDKTYDAIVVNQGLIEALEEVPGYENLTEHIREVEKVHLEVETTTPKKPEKEDTSSTKSDDVLTIYVSGSDTRYGLNTIGRSDVNIIVSINPKSRQVLLVSTPRDYYVPLSISGGIPDKLTHAGIYGIDVSMDTMEMLYDLEIDYYFRLNFTGFVGIIDALGGVNVYSDYTFDRGNMHFVQGYNYMDGETALGFARERYAFASGDRQRGKNQMAVIKAIIEKAMSPELLKNYTSIMNSLSGCFETSVPYDTIAELVRKQLAEGGSWNVVSYSVNGTGDSQIPYSMSQYAYVMRPDWSTVEHAKSLIQDLKDGKILSQE